MKRMSPGCAAAVVVLLLGSAVGRAQEALPKPKPVAEQPKVIDAQPAATVTIIPAPCESRSCRFRPLANLINHSSLHPNPSGCCQPCATGCRLAHWRDTAHKILVWATYRPLRHPELCACGHQVKACCTPPLYAFFLNSVTPPDGGVPHSH
jgi:hypothetical protein